MLFFAFIALVHSQQDTYIDNFEWMIQIDNENISAFAYITAFGEAGSVIKVPLLLENYTGLIIEDGSGNELIYEVEGDAVFIELGQSTGPIHEVYILQEGLVQNPIPKTQTIQLSFSFYLYTSLASVSLCIPQDHSIANYKDGGELYIQDNSLCISYFYSDVEENTTKQIYLTYREGASKNTPQTPQEHPSAQNNPQTTQLSQNTQFTQFIAILFLFAVLLLILFLIKKNFLPSKGKDGGKGEGEKETNDRTQAEKTICPTKEIYKRAQFLPEKEKLVYETLVKEGGNCTGVKLKALTGLSDPSLSRALKYLEQRELIAVERYGMTNMIILKKT